MNAPDMDPATYAPVVYLGMEPNGDMMHSRSLRLPGGLTHSEAIAAALAEAQRHPECVSYGAQREGPCHIHLPKEDRRFFVTAKADIKTTRGRLISQGEHILIDPDKAPEVGGMVLCAAGLQPWSGQADVKGVPVMVYSDEM